MKTLTTALKDGSINDFIIQEEARGVGPTNQADFDAALAAIVKRPHDRR